MNDTSYLKDILIETPIVDIITSDAKWRKKIELPSITPKDGEEIRIVFEIKSTFDVIVEFDEEQLTLKTGMKLIFKNVAGQWEVIEWIGNSK